MSEIAIIKLETKYGSKIPKFYRTIRGFIKLAQYSSNYSWSKEGIAQMVKKIVIEQNGINESQYYPEIHFFDDLAMGG